MDLETFRYYHRFAIADVLGVDAIPVQVVCRHERWQRVRDAVATEGVESGALPDGVDATHPDLVDVAAAVGGDATG